MFVRTEEGKIINTDSLSKTYDFDIRSYYLGEYLNIYKKDSNMAFETHDIIKKSKFIEELCDLFVLVNGDCHYPYVHNIPEISFRICKKHVLKKHSFKELYGAIWTDKGLIYVAKMNEKGELELL